MSLMYVALHIINSDLCGSVGFSFVTFVRKVGFVYFHFVIGEKNTKSLSVVYITLFSVLGLLMQLLLLIQHLFKICRNFTKNVDEMLTIHHVISYSDIFQETMHSLSNLFKLYGLPSHHCPFHFSFHAL